MTDQILIQQEQSVLKIHLNRPEKKNAMNLAMYQKFADAISDANSNDDIRVVYIGALGDAFCSGNDLQDFLNANVGDPNSPLAQFMQALKNIEKPVVAGVQGLAVGIGTTLLLHCDLVYASESAMFSLPFVKLGVCAEYGSSMILPLLCGRQKASELLLFGDAFSASDAKEIGIVNQLTTDAELEEFAISKANILAQQPPEATRVIKQQLKAPYKELLDQVMQAELEQFLRLLNGEESQQIINAFFSK